MPLNASLLIIDAHHFTRQSIGELLRAAGGDLRVHEAARIEAVPEEVLDRCDVVLIAAFGAEEAPEHLLKRLAPLRARRPGVPVAVLGTLVEIESAMPLLRSGVQAYLSPLLKAEQIIAVLELVIAGGLFIAPAATTPGYETGAAEPASPKPVAAAPREQLRLDALTPREREVLGQIRRGKANKVIAYELGMSENTVKVHVARMLKKLNAPNRTAAANIHRDHDGSGLA